MLIRALPAIRACVPDVLYAIVGEGDERGYLERLVRECDVKSQVQFLGNLADAQLLECYQQCDLFCLPNREIDGDIEGFGMVLVEAQACGKPVVAGCSGGTSETMNVGATGVVVDCTAPEPLAAAVVRLLSDTRLREAMGSDARCFVRERFDWAKLAAEASALFEATSNRRGRNSRELLIATKDDA